MAKVTIKKSNSSTVKNFIKNAAICGVAVVVSAALVAGILSPLGKKSLKEATVALCDGVSSIKRLPEVYNFIRANDRYLEEYEENLVPNVDDLKINKLSQNLRFRLQGLNNE